MAPNKSPAFQFYPRDFVSGTATMSLQEVGAYMRLLCYAWDAGSVPAEGDERARIMVCSKAQERDLWKKVGKKFVLENDVYLNERMEEERRKQSEYRRRQSDKGKASAASRLQPEGNHGSTTVEARLDSGSNPTSTLLSSSSSSSSELKNTVPPAPARPLISGQANPRDWGRIHGNHVSGFCDWVCLPDFVFEEFRGKSGQTAVADQGRAYVRGWALKVRSEWGNRPIGEDGLKFWRARWSESHATKPAGHAPIRIQDILDKEAAKKAAQR
jgi:uncharacterized protein YdaU (DUF1376 family)